MASFLSKIKLPTAIDSRSTFDLSCDHVTTMDFFNQKVTYTKEIMPNETTEINLESFVRLDPLVVPTFGRMQVVHRAFFVPYRTVWKDWNAFITGSMDDTMTKKPMHVPVISDAALSKAICFFATGVDVGDQDVILDNGDIQYYYQLPSINRTMYDLVNNLGYKPSFISTSDQEFSALPLLCYAKAMCDWMVNNNWNTDYLMYIKQYCNEIVTDSYSTSEEGALYYLLLNLANTATAYEQDYFTSACKNPNGPDMYSTSSITILNNSAGSNGYVVGNSDASVVTSVSQGSTRFNQFALDALKHVSDYLKRHQLVGSQIIDRYLAHYGVKLNPATLNRSTYLGKAVVPIQIGDVISTSDTDGAVLGDYAGKGVAYGNDGHFKISSEEFGQLIIISTIVPKIGYVQGMDRQLLHKTREDFFQPEFDGLGYQAIGFSELYRPMDGTVNSHYDADGDGVFGFTPRYAEYKIAKDRLSGDYIFNSRNAGEDSWYLFRDATKVLDLSESTTISASWINAISDKDQYKRIFNASTDADPFRCIYHFNVKASLPTTPLFDNYEWHEEGKEVVETINGSGNLAGND